MIPVLIYLFLRTFGENHYSVPVFYESGLSTIYGDCPSDSTQHLVPNFSLTNQSNQVIEGTSLNDKITIVDFFFTSCPSICPIMSSQMERVQDAFKDNPNIQILSVSVDPTYDSVEVLKSYAQKHQAIDGFWHFLTGDKDNIYELATCGFALPTIDGNGDPDEFVHSDKFVLVDKERRIRGYYSGTNREEVDRLILEIKILLYEYNLAE